MKRSYLNWTVDAVLGLGALGLVMTGLLLVVVLPAHSRSAAVWGWTRHDWGDVHFWLAMSLLGVGLFHLALHWKWVCVVSLQMLGRKGAGPIGWGRHLAGAVATGLVVLLIGGFLWLASLNKVADPGRGGGRGLATSVQLP